MNEKFRALRLAGRCTTGNQADGGRVFHAVPVDTDTHHPLVHALCGATYGRTSAGWASHDGNTITCRKCRRRLDTRRGWPNLVTRHHQ